MKKKKSSYTFCVDFDGTCVTHDYPLVGKNIGADTVLKELVENGHKLVLFTMRSDTTLSDAVKWFEDNGIALYGIQKNPTQYAWTSSPKAYADYYIDDAAIGCPLKYEESLSLRSFVDWNKVREELVKLEMIKNGESEEATN